MRCTKTKCENCFRQLEVKLATMTRKITSFKYRECVRNHAASIGGHTIDGCGEFMPGGVEGTQDALRCAACGCHRSFHRKDVPMAPPPPPPFVLYNGGGEWEKKKIMGGFAAVPSLSSRSLKLHHGGASEAVDYGTMRYQPKSDKEKVQQRLSATPEIREVMKSKRLRTKFTREQKEKMIEFAERLGWKIRKSNDVAMIQFCSEIGISRHVLQVWMYNNKKEFLAMGTVQEEQQHQQTMDDERKVYVTESSEERQYKIN